MTGGMSAAAVIRPGRFKLTPLYHWVAVGVGMTLVGVLAFAPDSIPYSCLGPVGTFLHYIAYDQSTLIKLIFVVACAVHVGEGSVALWMCRRMGLGMRDTVLWTVQTTLLGISSLIPLRKEYKKFKAK